MRKKINKRTITSQVADEIRSRILQGDYKAGEQLRQEHIASDLGVSRIPVREALHQLNSEGFVTLVSHKGSIVSEVSPEEFLEYSELRAKIEPWLLSLAIPRMTDEHFERIQVAADEFLSAARASERTPEANWAFHKVLYEASGRTATIEILRRVNEQIERHTRMIMTVPGIEKQSHREHLNLIKLCKRRDVDAAIKMLEAHISEGTTILANHLHSLRVGKAGSDSAEGPKNKASRRRSPVAAKTPEPEIRPTAPKRRKAAPEPR
jgi:DNA-binding GntR family transcriptional regulator